jgi:hypothetical protein
MNRLPRYSCSCSPLFAPLCSTNLLLRTWVFIVLRTVHRKPCLLSLLTGEHFSFWTVQSEGWICYDMLRLKRHASDKKTPCACYRSTFHSVHAQAIGLGVRVWDPRTAVPPRISALIGVPQKEESQGRSRCSLVLLQEQIDVDWDNLLLR